MTNKRGMNNIDNKIKPYCKNNIDAKWIVINKLDLLMKTKCFAKQEQKKK